MAEAFSNLVLEPAGILGGWQPWSPRAEIAPLFSREDTSRALVTRSPSASSWGAWKRSAPVEGGRAYRFEAFLRARGVSQPQRSIRASLEWRDARGNALRPPDFAAHAEDGGRALLRHCSTAPDGARSVRVALWSGWTSGGTVTWDYVSLREDLAPPSRIVRAATVHERPRDTLAPERSVEAFCRRVEQAGPQKPDVVCLPEGVTLVGTGRSPVDVAEPLRGPTAKRLGEVARKHRCHVVAGIYEREGSRVYNTALLIGRSGEILGSYRKTHLPREEVEAGLSPGDEYPVFQTDFGRLGILICWDVQFPEPARALAVRGAEIILLPIWGGSEVLTRARAIENHLFLVSSSYDMRSFVLDPTGEIVAEATAQKPVAVAELKLGQSIVQPWLGDMSARTWQERRSDLHVDAA